MEDFETTSKLISIKTKTQKFLSVFQPAQTTWSARKWIRAPSSSLGHSSAYLPPHLKPRAPRAQEMLREKQGRSPVRSQQQATATPGLARRRGAMAGAAAAPGTRWIGGQDLAGPGAEAACSGTLRPPLRVSVAGPAGRGAQELPSDFLCFRRMPLGPLHAFHIPDGLPHLPPLRALGL